MTNHFDSFDQSQQQDDKSLLQILLEVVSGFHQYYQGWTLSTKHTIDKSYYPFQWY